MVKTRRLLACVIASVLAAQTVLCGAAIALAANSITVEVDGSIVDFPDQQPAIVDGRVLVPVRGVFETLGYAVSWDQSTQTAMLIGDENNIAITVGKPEFENNENTISLDVPAQVIMGRVMLPFRAVLESIGCGVIWDGGNLTVRVFTDGLPPDAEGMTDTEDAPDPKASQEPYVLPPRTGRQINPGDRFGVDIRYNRNVVFHGSFYVEPTSVSRYIEVLHSYRERLPDTVRIFCLLVPSHVEFMDKSVSPTAGTQRNAIQSIYNRLDEGIVKVDAYSQIAQRVNSEYLYFRTDSHWTALGAYYAYLAFAESAGFAPVTIYNYLEFAVPNFIGSYAKDTQSRNVLNHPDTLYYYQLNDGTAFSRKLIHIPEDVSQSNYRVFMGGDYDLIDFSTSNENGKTLVVIKDSNANAFIPWVSPHYQRIVVIDPRHYREKIDKFLVDKTGIDILMIKSANTPSYPAFVEQMAGLF